MKNNWIQKGIAVSAIILFIGVAIAPSIDSTVVKTSDDLVEVTSQACGIQGFGNTTVKLTKEQYQNLEQYLIDFRTRLNQTTTREEAVPIFKDAVVELNKYGLLPKGMSLEQAQKLVTGCIQLTGLYHFMEKTLLRNKMNDSNFLCLVYSDTDNIYSVGPILRWIDYYEQAFEYSNNIFGVIAAILFLPWVFGPFLTSVNPFRIFYILAFGGLVFVGDVDTFVPANGYVATFGLIGKKIFQDQPLWGRLPLPPIREMLLYEDDYYPGICGFTGIQICLRGRTEMYNIGSALWVKIGSEHP